MGDTVKYTLDESRLPEAWYNLVADLPSPPPPVLHPGTLQPVGPDDLEPLFPMALILQEVRPRSEIEIPGVRASIGTGGRRRSSARGGSSRRSTRPPASTTSTRA